MKTLSFNIIKPLTLTALFAAGLNTASAEFEDPGMMKLSPSQEAYEKNWLEHHKSEWERDNKALGIDPNYNKELNKLSK